MSLALFLFMSNIFLDDISSFLDESKALFVKFLLRFLNNFKVFTFDFTYSYIIVSLAKTVVGFDNVLTLLQALLGSFFISLNKIAS